MNQIEKVPNKDMRIKKSKVYFKKHEWLYVKVRFNAYVPYEKSIFHKIIADSQSKLKHKNYILYIHENYVSIRSHGFLFETIKIPLHDELWDELYCVFCLSHNIKDFDPNLIFDKDREPI